MGYSETILSIAGLNMILALSFYTTLAVGQFSLAQVGFWAIGAYSSAVLTTLYGVPLLPALLAGGALCAVIGAILGYPCLRIRGIYLALATLGFSETVQVFFANVSFQQMIDGRIVGPDGLLGFRNIPVQTTLSEIFGFLLLLVILLTWLNRSLLGAAMAAVREDETAAHCVGVDVVLVKVLAFSIGAAIAGVGGGLYANYASYIIAHDFNFHLTLVAVLFVAVGGIETFWGPILGALVLTVIPEYFRFLQDYRMIFYGVLVVAIVIVRPKGLIDDALLERLRRLLSRGPAKRPAG